MSTLGQVADVAAPIRDVRLVPEADISPLSGIESFGVLD